MAALLSIYIMVTIMPPFSIDEERQEQEYIPLGYNEFISIYASIHNSHKITMN